jgi:hypothetical protein
MVHSLKLIIVGDGHRQTSIGFAPGKTIRLGTLEFIADHSGSLSVSLEGNGLGAIFVGMVHSGLLSLHALLEESADEDDTTSSGTGGGGFPSPFLGDVTW